MGIRVFAPFFLFYQREVYTQIMNAPLYTNKRNTYSNKINISVIMNEPANPRYPNESEDLNLATKFRNMMQTVLNEDR